MSTPAAMAAALGEALAIELRGLAQALQALGATRAIGTVERVVERVVELHAPLAALQEFADKRPRRVTTKLRARRAKGTKP